MISTKDIEKLASLARIHLVDAEKESLRTEIDSILEYVGQIQSASTEVFSNGAGASGFGSSTQNVSSHRNVFRDDKNAHESGINTEALLNEAPEREGDYVKVKDIF